MERRSTSDLLRDLQAISSEVARRHAAEQQDGGGPPSGSGAGQPPWSQISETRIPVGIDAGVGQNVTEASQGIPTI